MYTKLSLSRTDQPVTQKFLTWI